MLKVFYAIQYIPLISRPSTQQLWKTWRCAKYTALHSFLWEQSVLVLKTMCDRIFQTPLVVHRSIKLRRYKVTSARPSPQQWVILKQLFSAGHLVTSKELMVMLTSPKVRQNYTDSSIFYNELKAYQVWQVRKEWKIEILSLTNFPSYMTSWKPSPR